VPYIVAKKGISDNLGSFLRYFIYDYLVDAVGRCGTDVIASEAKQSLITS
jgi:hypothetical protein